MTIGRDQATQPILHGRYRCRGGRAVDAGQAGAKRFGGARWQRKGLSSNGIAIAPNAAEVVSTITNHSTDRPAMRPALAWSAPDNTRSSTAR